MYLSRGSMNARLQKKRERRAVGLEVGQRVCRARAESSEGGWQETRFFIKCPTPLAFSRFSFLRDIFPRMIQTTSNAACPRIDHRSDIILSSLSYLLVRSQTKVLPTLKGSGLHRV